MYFRYIQNVSRFWLDLISIIPFEIANSILVEQRHQIFLYWNLNRVLRLVHYFRSQREQYQRLHVTLFRYNLAICIPSLLLIAHFIACIFYGISRCDLTPSGDYLCDENSWTHRCELLHFVPQFWFRMELIRSCSFRAMEYSRAPR